MSRSLPLELSDSPRASDDAHGGRYSQEVFGYDPYASPTGGAASAGAIAAAFEAEEERRAQRWAKMRHAVGVFLLLVTVFLWTAGNFLASTIFADSSYSKPYLVTYVNTASFILPLIPMLAKHAWDDRHSFSRREPWKEQVKALLKQRVGKYKLLRDHESGYSRSIRSPRASQRSRSGSGASSLLLGDDLRTAVEVGTEDEEGLTLRETVKLALEFCILWFIANYFASACLSHTTVASATILGSTSSIWTLLFGALFRVERFTLRKFVAVLASLGGVVLISSIDVSGSADSDRGTFPVKGVREVALGDAMAFVSAAMYGFYAILLKKRCGSESRVNMPLFFGLVGLANVLFLWPGLFVLHVLGIEPFELPPTNRILTIVLVNAASSLVSDYAWAYSMLLISPLVVSVGLSLTIPLSLVGQMVISGQFASGLYWVGALIMFLAFVFINREDGREDADAAKGAHGPTLTQEAGGRRSD